MKNIGYLGLGVMGHGMSVNLIQKSSQTVYGFDPVEDAVARFAAEGGSPAASVQELCSKCDIIFDSLPTNEIVWDTVHQIMEYAAPGTIIVDMGSTAPHIIRSLNEETASVGITLLDCPVSGGKTGADNGTLAIMCGGDVSAFETVKPYLEMMGSSITYMGGSGCGSIAKLANNMMVGAHLAAVGEAFAFAKKAGIDPSSLFEAIKSGFAQSAVMDQKVPKILERDFDATARIAVHHKDIKNALDMAGVLGVDLPLTDLVNDQMNWIKENGLINEDQCAMVKYYEAAMGVVVK